MGIVFDPRFCILVFRFFVGIISGIGFEIFWLCVSIYLFVYSIYLALYIIRCVATLNDRPETYFWNTEEEHDKVALRAYILGGIMTWSYITLIITSLRAWLTAPGEVPQNSDWMMVD